MLLARLCASPKALKETVVLRKLTQSEWDMLQETNKLPVNDAICVLVVPPLDNDPRLDVSHNLITALFPH